MAPAGAGAGSVTVVEALAMCGEVTWLAQQHKHEYNKFIIAKVTINFLSVRGQLKTARAGRESSFNLNLA